ncbi:MAG: MmcB family DNA repair protein [Methylocystis sp.]|nr:MmcB family DNA repair protein [Methylocystis sp.]MBI3275027.1 MmcB family DNA repair protein [Methylocystis sp.]
MESAPATFWADGRPEHTRAVTRGVRRFWRCSGFAVLTEFPLLGGRRADLVALASDGAIRIVEIKSSSADFRADCKWLDYQTSCDRFYFAIPGDLAADAFPQDAGLIVADAHGAILEREAPVHKLAPAGRRAMLIRFARVAAERLHAAANDDDFRGEG